MKRRKKLFLIAAVPSLVVVAFAVIYFAYPRVLLKAVVAWQRSDAGFECRSVQVEDWSLPYIDSQPHRTGNQETIVLVHGFGDTKDRFIALASGLADDYRIVAVDLPGFGESAIRLDEHYSAAFYVDMLAGFLDQLKIDSAHLVGYSMGGILAAKLASESPSRVRSLTLLAPAGLEGDQPSDVDRILSAGKGIPLTYRDRDALERLMLLDFNQRPEIPDFVMRALLAEGRERADVHELIFRQLFDRSQISAFEKAIAALPMPTLLIWGTDDRIVDVSAADRWLQLNPNIRLVKLPGVSHGLIHQSVGKIQVELRAQIAAGD